MLLLEYFLRLKQNFRAIQCLMRRKNIVAGSTKLTKDTISKRKSVRERISSNSGGELGTKSLLFPSLSSLGGLFLSWSDNQSHNNPGSNVPSRWLAAFINSEGRESLFDKCRSVLS